MHEIATEHMMESILQHNEDLAEHNREHFEEHGLWVVNLMSAPGAGKTTLLSATLDELTPSSHCSVIEGDMVGDYDAVKLRRAGVPVVQISTGRSCHLDAQMVARVVHQEDLGTEGILFIENVGNLVCPAEFPLGEHKRVVLLSVTEGQDKPLKYPVIFRNADVVVFTKCDLLELVDFDVEEATSYVRNINPQAEVFPLSVKSGRGMERWFTWLRQNYNEAKAKHPCVSQSQPK